MKKCLIFLVTAAILLSSLISCATVDARSASFFLMDTQITVTLYTDAESASEIHAECRRILVELDRLWSRSYEESDISRFNESAVGEVSVDERTAELLLLAKKASENTSGAFDVTVAPLIELWQRCEERGTLPTEGELSAAKSALGGDGVTSSEGALYKNREETRLDLGGIGKGAAISALVSYLSTTDVIGALVSFGSNVAVVGKKPSAKEFRIALRDPKNTAASVGTLLLSDGEILSVSGDYERYYEIGNEKYHHVLDPQTGYPSQSGLSSVAVVCRDGALADALSTALLVMGEARARELYASGIYDFEAVFITSHGVVSTTEGISLN